MNFGSLLDLAGPMSGVGLAGNPMSGIGVMGGMMSPGGQGGQAAAAPGQAIAEEEKRKKKEGIASMLSGIGKGQKDASMGLRPLPQQQGFDVQSLIQSLLGG